MLTFVLTLKSHYIVARNIVEWLLSVAINKEVMCRIWTYKTLVQYEIYKVNCFIDA